MRVLLLLPCVAGFLFTAGCGMQEYEDRLAQTQAYFAYRQKIDGALELNVWSGRPYNIDMRPPKGYREIPGPSEEGAHDLRQPPFIRHPRNPNYRLPGLIGAWQGQIRVTVNGEDTTLPGYLFLCTNHSRFLELDDDNPPDMFLNDLLENISPALDYGPPSDGGWNWTEERVPEGTPYVKRKTYEWINLKDVTCNIQDQDIVMDFRVHQYTNGEIQMALISVVPQESVLDPRERIETSLMYTMELLTMGGDVPRKTGAVQSSGGGF